MNEFEDFSKLISDIGEDFRFVQGKGGNASFKQADHLLVKASGSKLKDALVMESWVHCRIVPEGSFEVLEPGKSASIEAPLHSYFKNKFIIHLHPIGCIARGLIAEPNSSPSVDHIPYVRPGEELLFALQELLPDGRILRPILLGNHGVLLGAESVEECAEQIKWLEQNYELNSGAKVHDPEETINRWMNHVKLGDAPDSHQKERWRLTPDHCVFLGPDFPVLNQGKWRFDSGNVALDELNLDQLEMLEAFLRVLNLIGNGPANFLSQEESYFLSGWDVETARK